MIYLFYGKDSFRIKRKTDEWINDWIAKNGKDSLSKLDGKNNDFSDLKSEFFSCSMFSSKKLVIVSNFNENIKLKDSIMEMGNLFVSSENILLLIDDSMKTIKSDSFLNFLKKNGVAEEFPLLEEKDISSWIIKEAEGIGIKIKEPAVSELFKNTKGDLWQIENELKKLSNYVLFEERSEITLSDVDKLVDKIEDGNIFAITDAIGARNKKSALTLIDNYLKNGGIVLVLFATIATHVKNLLVVKMSPNMSASELGMAPFVRTKCLSQSARFELEELKNLFELLIELDKKIKVGQIGQIEAVETFILAL
ncbi:DNA polymerase III subunit delta [bacterium]|nr:DNA polymerase III subunit delta [bacterium]